MKTIMNNILADIGMKHCAPACGYWLQNTTLPSVKYLKGKMDYSIIDNKFLLVRFHDISIKSGPILLPQTFEIYTNSEPMMHTKMVCNRNHKCDMYLYLSVRRILNKLFKGCFIYDSEYGVYSEYEARGKGFS